MGAVGRGRYRQGAAFVGFSQDAHGVDVRFVELSAAAAVTGQTEDFHQRHDVA